MCLTNLRVWVQPTHWGKRATDRAVFRATLSSVQQCLLNSFLDGRSLLIAEKETAVKLLLLLNRARRNWENTANASVSTDCLKLYWYHDELRNLVVVVYECRLLMPLNEDMRP